MAQPSSPRQTVPLAAAVWLVVLTLAWGTNWPIMKVALAEFPIYTFRYVSGVAGGLLVLLISMMQGNSPALARGEWKVTALAALFNVTGWFYFTALGLTLLPAGRSAVLAYTMPLFAILAAWMIRREPVTRQKWLGIGFGLVAILLLLSASMTQISAAPLGVLAILCAAASWGIGTVIQKRSWRTPVLTLAGWQLLLGCLPLALFAAIEEPAPFARVTWDGVLALGYVTAIGIVFGFWAWFTILSVTSASVAAIAVLPVPMVGVITSILVLGERAGWRELLALVFITLALATVLPLPRPFRR